MKKNILTESQQIQKLNFFLQDGMSLTEAQYLDNLIAELDEEIEALEEEEVEEGLGNTIKRGVQTVKGKYHKEKALHYGKKTADADTPHDYERMAGKQQKHLTKWNDADRKKKELAKQREKLTKQREKLG